MIRRALIVKLLLTIGKHAGNKELTKKPDRSFLPGFLSLTGINALLLFSAAPSAF